MGALFPEISGPARSMGSHQSANAGTHTWLTPPPILTALGLFDLDPCACPEPRPWATAARMWTRADQPLRREWLLEKWVNGSGQCQCSCHYGAQSAEAHTSGFRIERGSPPSCPICAHEACRPLRFKPRVFLNPPFGPKALVMSFMTRLADHDCGTALLFARTETELFHETVWPRASAILFLRGRPHFYHQDGRRAAANSGAPVVLVAYGQNDAHRLRESGLDGRLIDLTRC